MLSIEIVEYKCFALVWDFSSKFSVLGMEDAKRAAVMYDGSRTEQGGAQPSRMGRA